MVYSAVLMLAPGFGDDGSFPYRLAATSALQIARAQPGPGVQPGESCATFSFQSAKHPLIILNHLVRITTCIEKRPNHHYLPYVLF